MHDTPTLPELLGRITVDGRPRWQFTDGSTLPVVAGGATATDEDTDTGTGEGDQSGGDDQGEQGAGGKAGKVTFTPEQQAHVDALIGKATGRAKGAAERDLKAWLEQQAMSEADRATAERAAAEAERDAARREALEARVEAAAERAAIAAGVKADRVDRFLRLVDLDLDDLTADGKVDRDAVDALVGRALEDVPEFKGGTAAGGTGASGADFGGGGGGGVQQLTRDDLKGMTPQQITQAKKDGKLKKLLGQ